MGYRMNWCEMYFLTVFFKIKPKLYYLGKICIQKNLLTIKLSFKETQLYFAFTEITNTEKNSHLKLTTLVLLKILFKIISKFSLQTFFYVRTQLGANFPECEILELRKNTLSLAYIC